MNDPLEVLFNIDVILAGQLLEGLRRDLGTILSSELDADLDLFSDPAGRNSVCSVLTSLAWEVERRGAEGSMEEVASILDWVEHLAVDLPPPIAPGTFDTVRNGILACFLEPLLPVGPQLHGVVMAHLGPATRALLPPQHAGWLDVEGS